MRISTVNISNSKWKWVCESKKGVLVWNEEKKVRDGLCVVWGGMKKW